MSATVQAGDNVPVRLHVVHPAPPAPGENDESTERDVELLLLARSLAGSEERIIVAGDLNDVAWSATTRLFRQISGLLDLRIGRGLYNTFSADHWYARWPLDHFFVSSHFKAIDIQRLAHIGSDHFPLLVELAVTDDAQPRNAVQDEDVDEERLHSIMRSNAAQTAQMPDA
jgi:endonuclease/exonuclease/phosphatase (EEP) superfamily protein YafD